LTTPTNLSESSYLSNFGLPPKRIFAASPLSGRRVDDSPMPEHVGVSQLPFASPVPPQNTPHRRRRLTCRLDLKHRCRMAKVISTDRFLIVVSIGWLITLHFAPGLHGNTHVFWASIGMIALNTLWSLWTISAKRRVLIGLNSIQIILFGVLAFQLSCAYGVDNYLYEHEPRFYDWVEFTAAHVLRAADMLHVLGEYGLQIQNITHNSVAAGMLLVWMHLAVDIFLLGLLFRLVAHCWPLSPQRSSLQQGRRTCAWLLVTLVLYVGMAAALRLQPRDWLLWPAENLLRSVDIGDMCQIFHWRLHHGERGFWASTAAVVIRLVADVWLAKIVILLRLTVLQSWGLSTAQLMELLDHGNVFQRQGAAKGLAWSGAHAQVAVPALVCALDDGDSSVSCSAAWALGRMGPRATEAVPALICGIWHRDGAFRVAALRALIRIGPPPTPAILRDLHWLLSVSSGPIAKLANEALRKIGRGHGARKRAGDVRTGEGGASSRSDERAASSGRQAVGSGDGGTLGAQTDRSNGHEQDGAELQTRQQPDTRQGDEGLPHQSSEKGPAVQSLILWLVAEGFFCEERGIATIRTTLAAKGHQYGLGRVSSSMRSLTKKGHFSRRKNERKRWLYKVAAEQT